MMVYPLQVAYFGPASEAMDFMATKGLRCTLHYNPSDYLRMCPCKECLTAWCIVFTVCSGDGVSG